jgi:hypothetical protein
MMGWGGLAAVLDHYSDRLRAGMFECVNLGGKGSWRRANGCG